MNKEQETHFCGDPSECHYDEGYEKALKECKEMFDDYTKKLKERIKVDKNFVWGNTEFDWNICEVGFLHNLIDKLTKEVIGE